MQSIAPETKVILMTAYGGIEAAVNAMREGAADFVVKPWDNAKLIATVSSVSEAGAGGSGGREPAPTPALAQRIFRWQACLELLTAADVAAVLLRLTPADAERSMIQLTKALAPTIQKADVALLLDGHPALVARAEADGANLSGLEADVRRPCPR